MTLINFFAIKFNYNGNFWISTVTYSNLKFLELAYTAKVEAEKCLLVSLMSVYDIFRPF